MKMVKTIGLFSVLLLFFSCVANKYNERMVGVRSNYVEHFVRDSVFLYDSVFVAQKSDTVFFERLRTLYRDRVRVDTFILRDTVYKEKVVERVKKNGVVSSFFWSHLFFPLLLFLLVVCVWRFFVKFLKI